MGPATDGSAGWVPRLRPWKTARSAARGKTPPSAKTGRKGGAIAFREPDYLVSGGTWNRMERVAN